MKLKGKNNIIYEDDIILSDGVSTLSERFSSLQSDIDRLKSNVKWIYKYGGVGSGKGGGGTSSKEFSVYATLNNAQLNNQSITLNGEGTYPLSIKINHPNGGTYSVTYTYSTKNSAGNTVSLLGKATLSADNTWSFDTAISLNNNATLTVTATDGDSTKLASCDYITNAYDFNLSLVNDSGASLLDEIFISTAASKGVNIKMDYDISIVGEVSYEYSFNNGEPTSATISNKSGSILFPIDSSLFEAANAGYYSADLNITVRPENLNAITLTKNISFSLIPEDLYMLITPLSGTIYTDLQTSYYEYTPGYITFKYRVYLGTNNNRSYPVKISLNGDTIVNLSVTERLENTFKVFAITEGENYLDIQVSKDTIYTKRYYFYVAASSVSIDWFDTDWDTQYYYRIDEVTAPFSSYRNKLYISQTSIADNIDFSGLNAPSLSGAATINTHIAIGLLYNSVNSDTEILTFSNSVSGLDVITLYQDLIITSSNNEKNNINIKKLENYDADNHEQYHLLQIYSQYCKTVGTTPYYMISFYIDGTLEYVLPNLVNSALLVTDLTLKLFNGAINLIDVDYKEADEKNNCDYEVYKYFLKYQNKILAKDISDLIYFSQYLTGFTVGLDGRVSTSESTINNIAQYSEVPTLVFKYQVPSNSSVAATWANLEKNYGEDGTGVGSDYNIPVSVQWSKGLAGVSDITFPSELSTALFRLALQGSSTKLYRVKNFTLSIENNDADGDVFLYSPNFVNDNTDTFLPETQFTLKADVVDSSHSNNTSCGKFINTVCRKFSEDIVENGYYKNYVRNCLEGFPCLVYIAMVTTDETTGATDTTYNYLGVYNFNLGREAYYNLGYKDLSVFGDGSNHLLEDCGAGFTFFHIDPTDDKLRPGLGVAEIQGGNNYFDFSQFDPTILFQQQTIGSSADLTYMFGDMVNGETSNNESGWTQEEMQQGILSFVLKVAKAGGYLFETLNKNFGSYDDGYNAEFEENGVKTGKSKNLVPNYKQQYLKVLENGKYVFNESNTIDSGTSTDLTELVTADLDTGRNAGLNYQSLSEYYTICMVLGLVDSVMKNLNIKTWNKETWYAAFYDMDTCLGINNAGQSISYFAFSDYWTNNKTTEGNTDYPQNSTVYRDFSPYSLTSSGEGYDVPSSYLFAVAKYTRLILGDEETYTTSYPLELYAKWRSNTIDNETHAGVLRNADAFMENFFSNNLGSINNLLVSYNYRSKYLSLTRDANNEVEDSSITWIATDYEKFNGTRINAVRDWLNARLHILDAYFNLNTAVNQQIQYLDLDTNTWKSLKIGGTDVTDLHYQGSWDVSSNPDVIVVHDIFSSTGTGIQTSTSGTIVFKCPENTPLLISSANAALGNYILGGENYLSVNYTTTGNQRLLFGGSAAWTYLQDINFVSKGEVYINSDKLSSIVGTSGTMTSITIYDAALNSIKLNSSGYTGTLTLTDDYPVLEAVDISGSKLNLNCNGLNITSLNCSNMNNSSAKINVLNCTKLQSFSCKGSTLAQLTMDNINSNLLTNGVFDLTNQSITTMELTASAYNATLKITDPAVLSISVTGFKNIVIDKCPNLKTLVINQGECASISVTNCTNSNLCITSLSSRANKTEVYLTNLTTLKELTLTGDTTITKVYLPDGVSLGTSAFSGMSSLVTLDGTNISITGNSTFLNCPKFTMKTSTGTYSDLSTNLTDLSFMFLSTGVDIKAVTHFLSNCVENPEKVTNLQEMYEYCGGIIYTFDTASSSTWACMANYTLASAYKMFLGTGITYLDKYLLSFGTKYSSNNGLTLYKFVNSATAQVDVFANIIENLGLLAGFAITFIDSSGKTLSSVSLKDVFNPTVDGVTKYPKKLYQIVLILNNSNLIYDVGELFNANWTVLNSLLEVFNSAPLKNINTIGLNTLPALKTLNKCFLTTDTEVVTLNTWIDWDLFIANRGSIQLSLYLLKQIDLDDYITLCNKFINSTTVTTLEDVFRNCKILNWTKAEFTFGDSTATNTTITDMQEMFCAASLYDSENEKVPMNLSKTFFVPLGNVLNVNAFFAECYFDSPIPFNLFNLRYSTTKSVTLDDDSTATLYTYNYRKRLTNMSYLFSGCTWSESGKAGYDPSLYDIPKNRIIKTDGTEITEGTYYINGTEYTLALGTEITDAQNITGYYNTKVTVNTNIVLDNPSYSLASLDRLMIPPDLFYGVANSSVDCSYALDTPLCGIIPEHIFTYCQNSNLSYVFRSAVIEPRQIYASDSLNVYLIFPDNYTSSGTVDGFFVSNYIIPTNTSGVTDWVFVISPNTISSNISYMRSAFGNSTWWDLDSSRSTSAADAAIGNQCFNFIGSVNNGEITEGFDLTNTFKNLRTDALFDSYYLALVYGHLVRNTTLDTIYNRVQDKTKYKVFDNLHGFSKKLLLPNANSTKGADLFERTDLTLSESQLESTGSKTYYTSMGFTFTN